jgi:hypothetical protein
MRIAQEMSQASTICFSILCRSDFHPREESRSCLSKLTRWCFLAKHYRGTGIADFDISETYAMHAAQKNSEARHAKIDERRRTYAVRWSEAIEHNEAYEFFWAACQEEA